MAVQVNLLPDIKQKRLAAKRASRVSLGVAIAILIAAVAIPIFLFIVNQGLHFAEGRIQDSISARKQQIKDFENINTMLTVQKNLEALPDLYGRRVYASHLMSALPSVLPQDVLLDQMELSTDGTIRFSGNAPSYQSVQKFYAALLYSGLEYNPSRIDPNPNTSGNFTNVVLENVSSDAEQITFLLSAQFNPELISGGE